MKIYRILYYIDVAILQNGRFINTNILQIIMVKYQRRKKQQYIAEKTEYYSQVRIWYFGIGWGIVDLVPKWIINIGVGHDENNKGVLL